jgi:hypothetical protein
MGLLAAVVLSGCKGSGSSSSPNGPTAQLRFIQGNPALQALDYQIDLGGTTYTGAAPNTVQPYITVAATSHIVSFFPSGTTKPPAAPAPSNCQVPSLTANGRYTLVLVNVAGTSTTPCVLFNEPAVTVPSGGGVVIYHNAAGNPTVKDPSGNPTANLYPVFCQPQTNPAPCANPTYPSSTPVVNGAATGQTPTALPLNVTGATSAPGIAFTVTNAANGTPLCQATPTTLPTDPTIYPMNVDSTDPNNFIPNGNNDTTLALYILDSPNATSGTNACPVSIAASFTF